MTMAYLTIAFCQYVNILSRRFYYTSVFSRNFFTNRILLWSIAGSILLTLTVIYSGFGGVLSFAGPTAADWICIAGSSGIYLLVFELLKARRRRRLR